MTAERFTEVFGHVVQDVPWAVERAFEQRPFTDTRALREAFQDAVLTGSSEQQLQLINAFHDLGAEDETGHALAVDHVALSKLAEEDPNDVVEIAKIANFRFEDLVADANPIAAARFSRLNELQ
jgi:2-oxo-4-hydroxy-4-carboxy--5-ureidoimidazoline (OHCU) decarboxylase